MCGAGMARVASSLAKRVRSAVGTFVLEPPPPPVENPSAAAAGGGGGAAAAGAPRGGGGGGDAAGAEYAEAAAAAPGAIDIASWSWMGGGRAAEVRCECMQLSRGRCARMAACSGCCDGIMV